MSNLTSRMDLSLELQTGLLNSSTKYEKHRTMDALKACVHSGAFIATSFFTYLIIVTVIGSRALRQNARYVLLCQHCICITAFNISGATLHGLRALRWPTVRLTCWILFDLQVVMARSLTITLTLMCMCTCLSICCPLRYPTLIRSYYPWVMLFTWLLALLNPVVFTTMAFIQLPWDYVMALDTECSTALESTACIVSALLLLVIMALLIVLSYVLIYLEGRRAGHFSRSNRKGRRTILIHALQMSLHILPAIIIVSRLHQSLIMALTTFLAFSIAQSLSPVVYGLRCKELQEDLPHFFMLRLGGCMNLSMSNSVDDSSSITVSSSGTAASTGTGTGTRTPTCPTTSATCAPVKDSDCEEKNKLEFSSACECQLYNASESDHEDAV